jgi:tRNA-splicing ligase RtcB (3'-phosphate/5'-hydroxy nucleic acid ligase)
MHIDGALLKSWGVEPGKAFKDAMALARALAADGIEIDRIREQVTAAFPKPVVMKRRAAGCFTEAIRAETDEDRANIENVRLHMAELMKCPVLEHGAIMPDACPSGNAAGTIPVGGAVVSRGIHPAFHSADICCSMYATVFPTGTATAKFMDALQASTRFGPGARKPDEWVADAITDELEETRNPFLTQLAHKAKAQLADQGDGNHFAYLGQLSVTPALIAALSANGQTGLAASMSGHAVVDVLVTHHGSRELGAQVYKRGIEAAVAHTRRVSPDTPAHQAWLDSETDVGAIYWQALQYVARWTKRNHQLVHERTLARLGITGLAAFGNEHNFVWQRGGLYYHGKGATPAWADPAGNPLLGLIPLNMAAPILLTLGRDNSEFASFSPHGAGRNKSRTALIKELGLHGLPPDQFLARSRAAVDRQTDGLDVRFFYDRPDVSESPIAYKSASQVRAQIEEFGLADVIGLIEPKGCIMAGDYDKPWMTKRDAKAQQRLGSEGTK